MATSPAYLAILLFSLAILVALGAAYWITREIRKPRSTSTASGGLKPTAPASIESTASSAPHAAPIASAATPTETVPLPSQKKNTFTPTPNAKLVRKAPFSRSEGRFYDFLREFAKDEYLVATKIPLRDLFGRSGILEQGLYSMYDNGHADFVLLEPTLKTPLLAIELDGTTHNDPKQIDRDRRKQELFQMSDLPLLRFRSGVLWGDAERAEILAALPKRVGA